MNSPRRLAFVVTEDWFFASHFLPMVRAAREAGFEPIVITRVREHRATIEAAAARVVTLEADRRSLNPLAVLSAVHRLSRILRDEGVERVHLIALRSILVGGAAAMLAGIRHRIFAVTGGGFLTARTDAVGRAAASVVVFTVRRLLRTRTSQFLFENEDDPRRFGLDPRAPEVTIVGGAGVDPEHYRPLPLPASPPLKVAMVSRMLWSKGVDVAVEAVTLARSKGAVVELSLFGAPDPANPKAISAETLREWSRRDGIEWRGVTTDPRAVWAEHHLACLPSRGGEGLPRTLLEAAACGRALLTTDVPGCRSFVRDGLDGLVVPPNDAGALAQAILSLAADPARVVAMQESARARIDDGFTEMAVIEAVAAMYRQFSPLR